MNLVIVESPAKAKTITKYLGNNYNVIASVGHIRDLPKSKFGVDIENDFAPIYIDKKDKADVIKSLRKEAKKAENVYLATDPDREGEAISWHLAAVLGLDCAASIRVTFNEITKTGIKAGMNAPRALKNDLINAQQARRILDRIVGYKLSPFLWKKVRRGLSAGRVQSVAVRLIVDREREISAFVPFEYFTIDAVFSNPPDKKHFKAKLIEADGKKLDNKAGQCALDNKEYATSLAARFSKNSEFLVSEVKKSLRKRSPSPPFTTSTLQQEASAKLGFNAKRTMRVAQELYEGIDTKAFGLVGLITYMRTDSLRISDEAANAARDLILKKFGKDYLPEKIPVYKTKKNNQDAHEAIRPSAAEIEPSQIADSLTAEQLKLYKLIWERFISSQMESAVMNTISIKITAEKENCVFKAAGQTVKFDGFTRLYESTLTDAEKEKAQLAVLPEIKKNDKLELQNVDSNNHFTQPPPRFTEASLIKALEENGIGRPSTYAPTIGTLIERHYVEHEKKQLKPTLLGETVTDVLIEHFAAIVNTDFTAKMEENLDLVADGKADWVKILREFYTGFEKDLELAEKNLDGKRIRVPEEPTDIVCEKCGKNLVIKIGRFGKFLGCTGFPECDFTQKIIESTEGNCPKCGKKMITKKSKKGRTFYACENGTDCGFMTWDLPVKELCPSCNRTCFKKSSKIYCAICEAPDTSATNSDNNSKTKGNL